LSDENHHFFLRKYKEYLSPYLETYAWCLLSNHFHFLVRVKSFESITSTLNSIETTSLTITEKKFLNNELNLSELIEGSFKRFFQSYALAFNKMHKRKGNLFYKPLKRLEVGSESHFNQAIVYIHANPVKHKIIKDFTTWKWSSYQAILSSTSTNLIRNEVLKWFGGKEQFIKTHLEMTRFYYDNGISIEDED